VKSQFSSGFLFGESILSDNVDNVVWGEYDIVIMTSSWDRRSICMTASTGLKSKHAIYLFFENRDTQGLRDQHDKVIGAYLEKVSRSNASLITGRSEDVEEMWAKIFRKIIEIHRQIVRPLNILLDLSACPRYYALAVLGNCIRRGLAAKITFFYSEGTYQAFTKETEVIEFSFTKGRWQTVPIPSLEGSCDPEKDKYFLVSVGFEGNKTMRVLHREDPDRISLLFPDPGTKPEYVSIAEVQNRNIVDEFNIPADQVVRVHAGDAIGAWKGLTEANLERSTENIHYLCCGTKPHALGLGLRALSLGNPTVYYNVPESHPVTNVYPSGLYWSFIIKDLSALF